MLQIWKWFYVCSENIHKMWTRCEQMRRFEYTVAVYFSFLTRRLFFFLNPIENCFPLLILIFNKKTNTKPILLHKFQFHRKLLQRIWNLKVRNLKLFLWFSKVFCNAWNNAIITHHRLLAIYNAWSIQYLEISYLKYFLLEMFMRRILNARNVRGLELITIKGFAVIMRSIAVEK